MTYSAQAGARRVVPLLAVGLGIAVAVMAFAPAAPTSSPGAAVVGIHEANYEVEGGEESPFKFYFRVHTGVLLLNEDASSVIEDILVADDPDYESLESHIRATYWGNIPDPRARGILDQIGVPWVDGDSHTLSLRLDRQCGGISWYCFHVFMNFEINRGQAQAIRTHLKDEHWQGMRGVLNAIGVSGNRPVGICKQVRPRKEPEGDC